jgi:hypothetical protein
MKIYNQLVRQLDSSGANYSADLSEVDVSDPDDIKVMAADPKGAVLVHLGSANFLERYQFYVAHAQEWRAQYGLTSVSLRYDGQIIMNPDSLDRTVLLSAMPRRGTGSVVTRRLTKSRRAAKKKRRTQWKPMKPTVSISAGQDPASSSLKSTEYGRATRTRHFCSVACVV